MDDPEDLQIDCGDQNKSTHRQGLRYRLDHFTWPWFCISMSTGSVAVVLYQTPYKFRGLITVGKVVFVIDLVCFIVFCLIITARFVFNPGAWTQSLRDPPESFYFGAFWASVALILENTSLYAFTSCGVWLLKALEVSFWCYFAFVLLLAVLQYQAIFAANNLSVMDVVPAWILPICPILLTGPLASVLLEDQPQSVASLMWVAGVLAQGLGWMVTIFLYVVWMMRLLCDTSPDPSTRPGMYIAVGPTGQSSPSIVIFSAPKLMKQPIPFKRSSLLEALPRRLYRLISSKPHQSLQQTSSKLSGRSQVSFFGCWHSVFSALLLYRSSKGVEG